MQQIKAATTISGHPALDQEVGLPREVVLQLEALAINAPRRRYLYVPAAAIVALDHRNFAREATSWETLQMRLHDTGGAMTRSLG
ncbi:hypothetical protein AB3X96_36830 [Paraburkholderia sp. BR13439]|uniref:hypothetical protein n=1 Tax=unclassified Paraburkholderia TaxID=2615204 RepID=UPI0034CF890C